jgi:putative DNA primase/helicase
MIGAVARVMIPPVKNDTLIILEGSQGTGKSSALKTLGGDWFSDTHFALGEKDGYQQMQGVWLCELAELDSFNKAESTRAKQFFGSMTDNYRPSYGRRSQKFPRQCVFAGSTNKDDYLKDATGNRRYWPVRCGKINHSGLTDDRDQLWAEAAHRFKAGAIWYVDDKETQFFEQEQEQRFQVDSWESVIDFWLHDNGQIQTNEFTIADVFYGALQMDAVAWQQPAQTRVALILTRLGWVRVRSTVERRRVWRYRRPDKQLNAIEVDQ